MLNSLVRNPCSFIAIESSHYVTRRIADRTVTSLDFDTRRNLGNSRNHLADVGLTEVGFPELERLHPAEGEM